MNINEFKEFFKEFNGINEDCIIGFENEGTYFYVSTNEPRKYFKVAAMSFDDINVNEISKEEYLIVNRNQI